MGKFLCVFRLYSLQYHYNVPALCVHIMPNQPKRLSNTTLLTLVETTFHTASADLTCSTSDCSPSGGPLLPRSEIQCSHAYTAENRNHNDLILSNVTSIIIKFSYQTYRSIQSTTMDQCLFGRSDEEVRNNLSCYRCCLIIKSSHNFKLLLWGEGNRGQPISDDNSN